ncbi:MAG: NUDIX domain-containing protein [Oscillospiraceae bacterium]|nr:NUDIX domain-containing protein [Oscillospiraceae bacterium]
MNFKYCPECGEKLFPKSCGDEGEIPYCGKCNRPFFPFSYPCVICLCVTEDNSEIALIKQSYVSEHYVNVAGYVKQGETPETAAVREVMEEIGLETVSCKYVGSYYYAKRDNLMLGYVCKVKKGELKLSVEVDSADWFPLKNAAQLLRQGSIAQNLLTDYLAVISNL